MKYFIGGLLTTSLLGMSFSLAQIHHELIGIHKDTSRIIEQAERSEAGRP